MNSPVYHAPIKINQKTVIKASMFVNGTQKGRASKKTIFFRYENSKKDSIIIMNTISQGKVDFSKSNTSLEDCKEYYIEDENNTNKIWVIIKNCKNTAEIYDYRISDK